MTARAVAALLAALVVAETGVAAAWRFDPRAAVALLAAALMTGAWVWRRARRDRGAERPAGARRAEARLLAVAALALAVPVILLPLPPDTDAQGFGLWALSIRDGGSLVTLAPWRPGIAYLYAPGALTLFATLSSLLRGVPMTTVMMGTAYALGLLFVALAGPFGEELARWTPADPSAPDDPVRLEAWRRAGQVAALLACGLWAALLDSHFTAVAGLVLALGAFLAWFRAWRSLVWRDMALAGVLLAALVVTHQDTALAAALGLVPAFLVAWATAAGRRGPLAFRTAAGLALFAILLSPWLAAIAPLLATGVASPFRESAAHVRPFVLYQGTAGLLALLGLAAAGRLRAAWALATVAWLTLLFDFSTTGLLSRALPVLAAPIVRFDYPFSLAWHGPVLPFLALGTAGLASFARAPALGAFPSARLSVAAALGVVLAGAFAHPLAALVGTVLPFHGVFGGRDDVAAMRWIARHAPRDARVLNYPGDLPHGRDWEGHWAPVVAERDCVYMRMAPFYLPAAPSERGGPADAATEQREMLAFWQDPADPSNAARLARARIRYVLVPEAVGDPGRGDATWRGRPAALLEGVRSSPDAAPYLAPVFRSGGAAVYETRTRP